ncbi:MAG: hypothetical protein KAT00_08915, partial [Planctomycetes bacterium]|nr:hypothetical protein [Planctomycetota bacterium]
YYHLGRKIVRVAYGHLIGLLVRLHWRTGPETDMDKRSPYSWRLQEPHRAAGSKHKGRWR